MTRKKTTPAKKSNAMANLSRRLSETFGKATPAPAALPVHAALDAFINDAPAAAPKAAAPKKFKPEPVLLHGYPYTIDRWYDRKTQSWVAQLKDDALNQIGAAIFVATRDEVAKVRATSFSDPDLTVRAETVARLRLRVPVTAVEAARLLERGQERLDQAGGCYRNDDVVNAAVSVYGMDNPGWETAKKTPAAVALTEVPVEGTALTLLQPADPARAAELSVDQRVAMAARVVEVGPKLPQYRPQKNSQKVVAQSEKLNENQATGTGKAPATNPTTQEPAMTTAAKKSAKKSAKKANGNSSISAAQRAKMDKIYEGAQAVIRKHAKADGAAAAPAGKLDKQLVKGGKPAKAAKPAKATDDTKYVIAVNNAKNGFAKQFFDALVKTFGKKSFTRAQGIEATKKAITEKRATSYFQFFVGNGKLAAAR